jgi:hypothetical protein
MKIYVWANFIISAFVAIAGLIVVGSGSVDQEKIRGEIFKIVFALAWAIWAAWLIFS